MKLALIGDPVAHSRSPAIHERLLHEAGIEGSYVAIRVPAGDAARAIAQLRAQGFAGCNVTSPLKEEALAACDVLTVHAREADAVNTVAFADRIAGTNTDGMGATAALREAMGSLRGRRVAVFGTGPTARAAIAKLIAEEAEPVLWGRDTAKVLALCERLHVRRCNGETAVDAAFVALPPDAILADEPRRMLASTRLVMDANYGDRSTLAVQLRRPVIDGTRMLELQAEASFDFWRTVGSWHAPPG